MIKIPNIRKYHYVGPYGNMNLYNFWPEIHPNFTIPLKKWFISSIYCIFGGSVIYGLYDIVGRFSILATDKRQRCTQS